MISKSFLKRSRCCFSATAPFSLWHCTPVLVIMVIANFDSECMAEVPLANWRMPFLLIESDFDQAGGSTSGMFWDGIGEGTMFDSSLRIRNKAQAAHYWFAEAALSGGAVGKKDNNDAFFHGELYNEIQFVGITARHLLHVDDRYNDDPYYPAHTGRFLQGRIEEATLQSDWDHGFFRIGRQNRNWGPFPDRSLLVSSNPYTYDAVEFGLFSDHVEFRHLFAPFSPLLSSVDNDGKALLNRYLTAHSLNIVLGKWVTFGITETVLFTRQGTVPDLQYINPFSLYSVINTNWEGQGNLMVGFQWIIRPGIETLSFRGQLVLDDFQVDDRTATDKEPNHWGVDAGLYWRDPFPRCPWRHLFKVEGTFTSKWLYTVSDVNADERYVVDKRSIGFSTNDGSKIGAGMVVVLPKRCFAGEAIVSFEHRGGNTPLSPWGDRYAIQGLPVETDTPVEKKIAVELRMFSCFRRYCSINGCGNLGWIHNNNNIRSRGYVFDPSVAIECSLHFGGLVFQFQ